MYVLLIGILGKWSRTERSGELRERLDGDGEISFFFWREWVLCVCCVKGLVMLEGCVERGLRDFFCFALLGFVVVLLEFLILARFL